VSTTTTPGTVLWRPQRLSWLAALAIAGQLILTASALLLPIWSEYGLIGDNISELGLGRYGVASFACAIVGMLVLTRTFRRDDRWRSFPRWAMLFPIGALALVVVQSEGPLVGLMQRLQIAMVSAWLILVALNVRSIVTPGEA
jgi:hypothetical protein